jgi:hypothetical protein
MERAKTLGLVASGLVAGLVLAGLTSAGAQTPTPTPHATASERPHKDGHRGHKGLGHRALHGEMTVRARDGAFRTIATQLGDVTAITATSVTVRSEDGFVRTYVRDAKTKVADGVAAGTNVRVMALVENGVARAVRVHPARPKRQQAT